MAWTPASDYKANGVATYPPASIDPRAKGYDWCLAYTKAAYKDSFGYMPFGQINTGNLKMSEIKMYCLGKQSVDKYKKMFSPGSPTNESWRAIDFTPLGAMCKFREIGISKILQKKFDFQAFAIDPLAKSEEDAYFNEMKVKLMMREAAQKAGSEMAESPLLAPQPGEPEDMEQLQMQKDFGYKHAMGIQAEKAINLVYYQNGYDEIRNQVAENLYDYGIAGITQYIDENGMTKLRVVNPEYLGLSYCEKKDFSDLIHWFEIVPTYVADLAPYYTKDQLDDICKKAINKNGNPNVYVPFNGFFNQAWNRFKVMVLQIKFLSYNDTVYKEERDGRGNKRFGKSSYKNKQFLSVNQSGSLQQEEVETTEEKDYFEPLTENGENGEASPKYINSTRKVRYKASWVIDTDYMHNWGLDENQNRKLSSWWDTDLDIQLYAPIFHRMQFTGMAERLIKLEDQACMTWFNLQNLSNKLIPYLINLDMNAVEGAFPFGKGGDKASPSEVVDFIFSNFVVPYRSTDLLSRNPNYKPVSIEATGQLAAFAQLYERLAHIIDMMRQLSGLNEATDGSTINPKNLNSTNYSMIESTNNALYLISEAEKSILIRTADAIVQKVQIAVKLGKVEGYAKALGGYAIDFFSINPDIALHEIGVFIEEAPTNEQREALWTDASLKESQGLLTIGDKAFIMTVRNLKDAYSILDYKIKKRQEEAHLKQIQLLQEQSAGNEQVAVATAELDEQKIMTQGEIDMELLIAEKMWDMEIEKVKKTTDLQGEIYQSDSRTLASEIQAKAKIIASEISAKASAEKQRIANKKPKPAKKN